MNTDPTSRSTLACPLDGTTTTTTTTASTTTIPTMSVMNWELIRQKLTGEDVTQSLEAAQELLRTIDTVHVSEYPLLLSALLPACSSVLGTLHNTNNKNQDLEKDRLRRATLLEWMGKLSNGSKEALRPHATHVVAVAHGVLIADSEENAVLASRLLFDLYKTYRNLPCDYVQPYLDFVIALYRNLPLAVQRNFTPATLLGTNPTLHTTAPEHPTTNTTPFTDQTKPIPSSTLTNAEKSILPVPMETSSLDATELPPPTSPTETAKKAEEEQGISGTSGTTTTTAVTTTMTTMATTQPSATTTPKANSTTAASATPSSNTQYIIKSIASFRVLTECPLIVMLLFQLYPKFMKNNIPSLIKVMMDALALRPPSLSSVVQMANSTQPTTTTATPSEDSSAQQTKFDPALKRAYHARARELVAAQAKTLSFLTYLLRTFGNELKPYENALATNVVALMSHCPRGCLSTRKELLVATRHLLNHSDFRGGFYRHIDAMLDERVLMGSSSAGGGGSGQQQRLSSTAMTMTMDPTLIQPLAYTTLADFVHHVRNLLTIAQVSRVVGVFSRILHDDTSLTLPLSTQYAAVRTLLSVVDLIFRDKDADPQLGRDMLVRMLDTLVDKLQALVDYFPIVLRAEIRRREDEIADRNTWMAKAAACQSTESSSTPAKLEALQMTTPSLLLRTHPTPADSVRDVQSMIRAIIVGNKTVIHYIARYRNQRAEMLAAEARENGTPPPQPASLLPPPGSNEEVASAMLKMTHTETAIVDRYIVTAIQAMKLLTEEGIRSVENNGTSTSSVSANESLGIASDKTLADQHRDALSYFVAAFVSVDAITLRRTLGRRLDILVDAIVDDSTVMVIPRHLLASDKTTSYEFCAILLDFLVERMDTLSLPNDTDVIFLEEQCSKTGSIKRSIGDQLLRRSQLPAESKERQRQRNTTFLQLFERVLKSLSPFPDNEAAVRRHLRRITTVCLRNSMENIDKWPESYCMLLRYVFRSISSGKFEESYKELLPLIPTVLNGLYRVLTASEDVIIRCTAIELCLTIPARLSSLLPHMNLLLRMIIPALDSNVGDLVNLGYAQMTNHVLRHLLLSPCLLTLIFSQRCRLRTLEFWVDNLNPLYLYPECSKQSELFSTLMQSLSKHLRPA